MRLDIRGMSSIKEGDNVLGRHVKVKVVKNKVAPPFRQAQFDIMFGEGISRSGELLDMAVEWGIVTKSGSWFSYGDSKLAQGREGAKRVIDDNPELADELEEKILAAIKENAAAAKKPAKKFEMPKAEPKDLDEELDDLDEDFPDDFSIDDDAKE